MSQGAGQVETIAELQQQINEAKAGMTREQRSALAKAELFDMAKREPHLRYLFPDVEFDD